MSPAETLTSVIVTLDEQRRDLRWRIRRLEIAIAAITEAREHITHTPTPAEITTDDVMSVIPGVRAGLVEAGHDHSEPVDTEQPDSPPAAPDSPPAFDPVGPQPKRRSRTGASTPDWQEVAEVIAVLKADGIPLASGLAAEFGVPESTTKNWSSRVARLGLTPAPTPQPSEPVTPAPAVATAYRPATASARGRSVTGLMCLSCDWHVLTTDQVPGIKIEQHVRQTHNRRATATERTPVAIPTDTQATE
jgi:hypothetical protein